MESGKWEQELKIVKGNENKGENEKRKVSANRYEKKNGN